MNGAHHVRLDELAAVGNDAHRGGHLQRRDADLIAHRHRRERAGVELRGIPDHTAVLAAKVGRDRLAESKPADVAPQPLAAELHADLDRPDVARLGDDVDERQHAVVVGIADDLRPPKVM